MELKDFYTSVRVKWALFALIVLVLILLAFVAGTVVGAKRAEFTSRLGDNYSRIFEGRREGFGMMRSVQSNGATGKVVALAGGVITVASSDNTEKIIRVEPDTLVRRFRDTASTSDIALGDNVIVLGEPTANGEIAARLIRIVPEASTTATHY